MLHGQEAPMFPLKSPVIAEIVALRGPLSDDDAFALRQQLWEKGLADLRAQLEREKEAAEKAKKDAA